MWLQDEAFWAIVLECYKVSIPVIQLIQLGDSRMPSMGDTVACWQEAAYRVDEFIANSVAAPARVRKIQKLLTDTNIAALGPLHFAEYALDPVRIHDSVFSNNKVMRGLHVTITTMASGCPWVVHGESRGAPWTCKSS